MPESLTFAPTTNPRTFRGPDGTLVTPPADWTCLPPGDAGLTRRVKAAGPSWLVAEKRGRKTFSQGLWAPTANIEAARAAIALERSTPAYEKRREAEVRRRDREQQTYVKEFEGEVISFLRFAPRWDALGRELAARVTAHATPVGSGTVARTERISVAERAESAIVAWMRHQTTAYDQMAIPRIKGKRREVRQELAQISRAVLNLHRTEKPHGTASCPLCQAIALT